MGKNSREERRNSRVVFIENDNLGDCPCSRNARAHLNWEVFERAVLLAADTHRPVQFGKADFQIVPGSDEGRFRVRQLNLD